MKKTLYFFSDGVLQRKDNTIFFETAEGRRFLPVEDVAEIMVFGEVNFNKALVEFYHKKRLFCITSTIMAIIWEAFTRGNI